MPPEANADVERQGTPADAKAHLRRAFGKPWTPPLSRFALELASFYAEVKKWRGFSIL